MCVANFIANSIYRNSNIAAIIKIMLISKHMKAYSTSQKSLHTTLSCECSSIVLTAQIPYELSPNMQIPYKFSPNMQIPQVNSLQVNSSTCVYLGLLRSTYSRLRSHNLECVTEKAHYI